MTPFIILLTAFSIAYLSNRFILDRRLELSLLGRVSLSLMLLVTGISHFTSPEPMVQMMPDQIPAKLELVYFTGVCELAAAAGLLWKRTARLTAILLIVFFILVLPANIVGSFRAVRFGGMEYGPWYLLVRIPAQIVFIGWAWFFGLHLLPSRGGRRDDA